MTTIDANTVAVLRRGDDVGTPLLFDASPLLASGVFAGPNGELLTGADAQRAAAAHPGGYEPSAKRLIDDGTVWLNEQEFTIVDVIAAVLVRVVREEAAFDRAYVDGVERGHRDAQNGGGADTGEHSYVDDVGPARGDRRDPVTGEDETLLVNREIAAVAAEEQPGNQGRAGDQGHGQAEENEVRPLLDQNHPDAP